MTPVRPQPPRIAQSLLMSVLPRGVRAALVADLADAYRAPNRRHPRRWYWGQVARAVWPPTLAALYIQQQPAESNMTPHIGSPLDSLFYDTRFALRGFRRRPFFTAMVVATLALGIGANATMFGVLDRLLLQPPMHIADAERVVMLHVTKRGEPWVQTTQPFVLRTIMKNGVADFADVAVATPTGVVRRQYYPIGRGSTASRVAGSLVSSNYFSVLGVHPALGRFFAADDDASNPAKIAVLGYGYWQRRYAGRIDALGQSIESGTSRYTIVGVAPKGFTGTETRDVDVWLPIGAADGLRFVKERDWKTSASSQWLLLIARLRPGASPERATAQATATYRNWIRSRVTNPSPERLARVDSQDIVLGSLVPGKSLWKWGMSGSDSTIRIIKLLGGVALMVMLIACANVANLLLVRSLGRRREIAVRLALGVSRRRLVGGLVVEGMVLSMGGAVGGVGIAALTSQFVRLWLIGDGAWTGGVVSPRVFAFTLVAGVVAGIATSLLPALHATRSDVASSLKAGASEGIVHRSRTRSVLLVLQAALAIVLLSGAGMFLRSLRNAASLDLGVDVEHTLIAQVNQSIIDLDAVESRRMFDRFAERVRTVPGVKETAVSVALPFSMSWGVRLSIPGRTLPTLQQQPVQYAVTPSYFDVLGIRLLSGRTLDQGDRAGAVPVALVNETMARFYWPNKSPIGACLRVGEDTMPCTTVVGVVANTNRQDLVEGLVPQIYRPLDQVPQAEVQSIVAFFGYTLIARARGDAASFVEPVRQAIQSVGPDVPYANVQTMRDLLGSHTRSWELGARVFTAFGALALVLAAIGLFSVVAFTIGQRMHEFGVRAALGAQRADILRLTLVRGIAPAAAGVILGIGLTLADPATLGVASAVMLSCAVVASFVPAWRATRVNPTIALRAD
jgi:predicted permease